MSANPARILIGHRVVIYPRGKRGVYHADFHYAGQHRRRSLKTTRRKTAMQRAVSLAARVEEGTLGVRPADSPARFDRTTLEQAKTEFIDFHLADGRRQSTVKRYRGILKQLIDFCSSKGVARVDQVVLRLIDAYRTDRRTKISEESLHVESNLVRQFFTWCADRRMTPENPLATQKFQRPKLKKVASTLTLAQVNAVLEQAPVRLRPILATLAFTGMRSGECRNLLVEDLDWEGRWLHVISRPGAPTKSGLSRKVPIHPRLAGILRKLPRKLGGRLFTATLTGGRLSEERPLDAAALNGELAKILKSLGIPAGRKEGGYTLHFFRHFFKSICVSAGVPREYVDDWQGHAHVARPSDLYFHTFDDESQRLIRLANFDDPPAAEAGQPGSTQK